MFLLYLTKDNTVKNCRNRADIIQRWLVQYLLPTNIVRQLFVGIFSLLRIFLTHFYFIHQRTGYVGHLVKSKTKQLCLPICISHVNVDIDKLETCACASLHACVGARVYFSCK